MDPVTRLPRIDSNICVACGSCVKACPRHLIELRKKQESMIYVACNNNDKLAIRMKKEDFTSVIDINLTSAFVGCREALKIMSKKRFGAVVNIASIVGETGNAGQVNYSASKGGLIAMTKSFAQEGSARDVRFNAVTPGFIATEMTDKLSDEIKESYTSKIPLKRFGSPKDIAESVAFLLSDSASYITGEVLKVNGGMYM
jgi:3-oxoacyl-[acyl-carrier protein] reductase